MSTIKVYGIKNCNTMKKAFSWLEENGVSYEFHDYKKKGADENILEKAFEMYGWENVINRRGMTWRKLPDEVKEGMDAQSAFDLAKEKTSVIKRPLLVDGNDIYLGFDEDTYRKLI